MIDFFFLWWKMQIFYHPWDTMTLSEDSRFCLKITEQIVMIKN